MAFPVIFALFIAMPIIEIYLLIRVGSSIGALATIGIVILTAVIGTYMLRAQGLSTMNQARSRLASGQIPAMQLMEGFALAIGGALLLTPGFVTDAIGFICLIPVTRRLLIAFLSRRVRFANVSGAAFTGSQQANRQSANPQRPAAGDVIEGEYSRKDD